MEASTRDERSCCDVGSCASPALNWASASPWRPIHCRATPCLNTNNNNNNKHKQHSHNKILLPVVSFRPGGTEVTGSSCILEGLRKKALLQASGRPVGVQDVVSGVKLEGIRVECHSCGKVAALAGSI